MNGWQNQTDFVATDKDETVVNAASRGSLHGDRLHFAQMGRTIARWCQYRMELSVELNRTRETANVMFAGRSDFGFVAGWRDKLGDDSNPFRTESVELTELAIDRFSSHSPIQPYVKSISDISDHIASDAASEVAAFVLLKCNWFPDSDVIGICHFRRSWCNNIILDYLAAHPFCTRPPEKYTHKVRGAGTALLYFVSRVAEELGSAYIWGEATGLSHTFYEQKFSLDSVKDLILAPRQNFVEFAEKLNLSEKKPPEDMKIISPAVEEVYRIEEESPPMAGNRFSMFSPPRTLARRFFDLPHHIQIEIVQALGLFEKGDVSLPDDQLLRTVFRRAGEKGTLAELWTEVGKRHRKGDLGENPFRREE